MGFRMIFHIRFREAKLQNYVAYANFYFNHCYLTFVFLPAESDDWILCSTYKKSQHYTRFRKIISFINIIS